MVAVRHQADLRVGAVACVDYSDFVFRRAIEIAVMNFERRIA